MNIANHEQSAVMERASRRRVIPKDAVIYRSDQPDTAYTVREPFYALRSKNPARRTQDNLEMLLIDEETAVVYRDGSRVEWEYGTPFYVDKKSIVRR